MCIFCNAHRLLESHSFSLSHWLYVICSGTDWENTSSAASLLYPALPCATKSHANLSTFLRTNCWGHTREKERKKKRETEKEREREREKRERKKKELETKTSLRHLLCGFTIIYISSAIWLHPRYLHSLWWYSCNIYYRLGGIGWHLFIWMLWC